MFLQYRHHIFGVNRVLNSDITYLNCEIMGFDEIFGKRTEKNVYLPKICIALQFEGEILALHALMTLKTMRL